MHVSTLTALAFDRLAIVRTDLRPEDLPCWLLTEAVGFEVHRGEVRALVPVADRIGTRFRRPAWEVKVVEHDDCPMVFGHPAREWQLTILHDHLHLKSTYTVVGPVAAFNPHFNEPSTMPLGGTGR